MAQKELVNAEQYQQEDNYTREHIYRMGNYGDDKDLTCVVYCGLPQDAPDTALFVYQLLRVPEEGGEGLPNARLWKRQEDGSFKELTRED